MLCGARKKSKKAKGRSKKVSITSEVTGDAASSDFGVRACDECVRKTQFLHKLTK